MMTVTRNRVSRTTQRPLRIAALFFLVVLMAGATPAVAAGSSDTHDAKSAGAPTINWLNFDYNDPEAHRDGPPLLMAIFNFTLLIILLAKSAGPAIKKSLNDRHVSIKTALAEGEQLRAEAAAKLEEYQAKIAGVDEEIDQLVATIRAAAEDEKRRILEQATKQAAMVKQEAEHRIAAEIERSRRALEREVVHAAIAAAETLLRNNTREQDQQRLVQAFVSDVRTNLGALS